VSIEADVLPLRNPVDAELIDGYIGTPAMLAQTMSFDLP
jgi:hypothetical protein